MKTVQVHLRKKKISQNDLKPLLDLSPDFVIAFADVAWASDSEFMKELNTALGKTELVGCSTAGEISNKGLFENSMVLTAIKFDSHHSRAKVFVQKVSADQTQTGRDLGKALAQTSLKGVFLFAPGLTVQGSTLLHGIKEVIGQAPLVSGGLAGDGGKFKQTSVFHKNEVFSDAVVALAFYGETLELHHSARAGFHSFGGVRQITKAKDNIVYEIDGLPALDVYKKSLGKHAEDLDSTRLMFPLAILNSQVGETGLIRGVLNIDESQHAIVLAGDVHTGTFFKLMRGENQGLIEGAKKAAEAISRDLPKGSLGLLVSCVARRMVMGEAVEDEIEAVSEVLRNCSNIAGYYSYGEFGPFFSSGDCQLHNQTMTISTLSETAA